MPTCVYTQVHVHVHVYTDHVHTEIRVEGTQDFNAYFPGAGEKVLYVLTETEHFTSQATVARESRLLPIQGMAQVACKQAGLFDALFVEWVKTPQHTTPPIKSVHPQIPSSTNRSGRVPIDLTGEICACNSQ